MKILLKILAIAIDAALLRFIVENYGVPRFYVAVLLVTAMIALFTVMGGGKK